MKKGKGVAIIVALIGAIGTISGSVIGVIWGKNNVNVMVQVDGESVVLKDTDVQELALENEELKRQASENEELKRQVSDYETQIENLKNESKDLAAKLENASGELDEVPVIEFKDLGLSIDGEEKPINKDKASVFINGVQYYSQDFIDSLLPDNTSAIMKDDMFYIGKIVKDRVNLFDRPVIEQAQYTYFQNSIEDTYGNSYSNILIFTYNDYFMIFNAGRDYSRFKCTVAMQEDQKGSGKLQIKADDIIIYTTPEEIINTTEPFDIDISINHASTISIGTIGSSGSHSHIFISNAVLYNQE